MVQIIELVGGWVDGMRVELRDPLPDTYEFTRTPPGQQTGAPGSVTEILNRITPLIYHRDERISHDGVYRYRLIERIYQ